MGNYQHNFMVSNALVERHQIVIRSLIGKNDAKNVWRFELLSRLKSWRGRRGRRHKAKCTFLKTGPAQKTSTTVATIRQFTRRCLPSNYCAFIQTFPSAW